MHTFYGSDVEFRAEQFKTEQFYNFFQNNFNALFFFSKKTEFDYFIYRRQSDGLGPPGEYQEPLKEGYRLPPNGYQQPLNGYQQPQNGYQQPLNGYQQPLNGYQQPQNEYQQPLNTSAGCQLERSSSNTGPWFHFFHSC